MVAIGEPGKAVVSELLPSDHELIESLGGSEFLRKQLDEHRERRQRLAAMVPELTEKYPDQWAALTESGELLIMPTLAELRAKFEEMDTPPGSNAIKFLDTDPTPWIL
jgi:hypothetical protein